MRTALVILVLCCAAAPAAAAAPGVSLDTPASGSATSDSTPLYSGQAGDAQDDAADVMVRIYSGSDTAGDVVQVLTVSRSGTGWATEGQSLRDGVYTARAEQADGMGDLGFSAPVTFTIDATRPDTVPLSGPSGPTNDASPEFAFESSDATGFLCRLYIAGDSGSALYGGCESPYAPGPLDDGSYVVEAAAVDGAGNQDDSPATWSFRIDTTAPTTSITAAPGNSADDSATFVFSSQDATRFECRLDSGSWEGCGSPRSYSSLTPGGHEFEVRAYDEAGNVEAGPARWSWQVLSPGGTTPAGGSTGGTIPGAQKQAVALASAVVRIRKAVSHTSLRRLARKRLLKLRGLQMVTAGTVEFRAIARVRAHGRYRRVPLLVGRREIPAAGTYSLVARLTKQGRHLVRRRRELLVDLKLGFLDRAGRVLWAQSGAALAR